MHPKRLLVCCLILASVTLGQTAPALKLTLAGDVTSWEFRGDDGRAPVLAFKLTLASDVTSSSLSHVRPGQLVIFEIIQDPKGGHRFTWPRNVKGASPISLNPNTTSVQAVYVDGATAYATSGGVQIGGAR